MSETTIPRTERREVRVENPLLDAETNRALTAQLREVIGADSVEVPVDRPRPSRGESVDDAGERSFGTNSWLMGVIGLFAAITVAAIVLTSVLNSYWFLGLGMLFDTVGLIVVASTVIRMTGVTERPDASLVIDLEQSGIADAERYFTDLVAEFRAPVGNTGEHRETTVEQDHAQAAEEQKSAMTPTGGRSRAVGPGN